MQCRIATALLLLATGCQKSPSEAAKATAVAPAKTTHPVSEADLNKIDLTEDAIRRLGLQTEEVVMRAMPRMQAYGADLMLPNGASIIVSAPLAGTLQLQGGGAFPQIGQRILEGDSLLQLMPMLSPERDVLTPAERIRFAEARNSVAQSQNDADAQVQQALVQVEAAQIALDRAERLLKDKSGTVRTVDEAKAQLKLAEKALEAAKARKAIVDAIRLDSESGTLQPLTITSPLSGLVRAIQVQRGQIVAAGAPLLEVMNDERMWVRVPVYVGDLDEIDTTRNARLTLLDGRQTDHDIEVKPIATPPTALSLASTVDLYFELPNPESRFRPGQKVGALLMLKGDAESIALPWSAVYHDIYGSQWVYEQFAERQFVRRRVEVTSVINGWAATARGPKVGTRVVTAGVAELAGTEFGFAK
jgi:RND family efflux transporter MFP subunit